MSVCPIKKSKSSITKMWKLRRIVDLFIVLGMVCVIPQLLTNCLEQSLENLSGRVISSSPMRAFDNDIDIMLVPMVRSILLMKQGMIVENERIQITLDEVPTSLKSIHYS